MQKIAAFLAAALIAGTALAKAQSRSPPNPDQRTPPASATDAERNPDRSVGGYKSPSNNVGGFTAGTSSAGSSQSTDNAAPRRNPDGSSGGTPENPHPR